ncbi:hypothetical protein H0N98_02705 [Candidatus Micrarchaeota archaeon]|nr:hypothetical protein [Candidatus Micrarchaeota archaeon]
MSVTTKPIPIADLNVSTENYRFEPVASQKEAIDKIIENQGAKLYNLAKNIVEEGLNPIERVLVTPSSHDTTRFNVVEGNRRIVVLKLLSNPELIDDPARSSLKNKFKKLHDQYKSRPTNEIECAVCDTPTEADKWIKLKHTGENDGIGTVSWTTQQIDRFREKIEQKSSIALQAIKIIQTSPDVPTEIKNSLGELKTTNLDRLISDPDVRKFLGIELNNGIIESSISEKEVVKGLTQVAKDLLDPNFNVKKIYTKDDRKDYIQKFNPVSKPNTNIKAVKPWRAPASAPTTKYAKAPKPFPMHRRYLIPKKCVMKITNSKVNKIYYELQKLDANKFTNAAAVLLRVFVELSIDCYLIEHKLPTTEKGNYIKLKKKANTVANELVAKKIADKTVFKGIRTAISDKDSILGIDTLHAYVHNPHFSPAPKDLIIAWDNIEEFMKKVWENI